MWIAAAAAAAAECPAQLPELAGGSRPAGAPVIVVWKGSRTSGVYRDGALVTGACWPVALAPGAPAGPKVRRGDLATPEGWFRTADRPWSQFYHALTVSYPTGADADRGLRDGLVTAAQADAIRAAHAAGRMPPMNTPLGGDILLHGGGSSADWTLGCVGYEDADIDALRALLPKDLHADLWIRP